MAVLWSLSACASCAPESVLLLTKRPAAPGVQKGLSSRDEGSAIGIGVFPAEDGTWVTWLTDAPDGGRVAMATRLDAQLEFLTAPFEVAAGRSHQGIATVPIPTRVSGRLAFGFQDSFRLRLRIEGAAPFETFSDGPRSPSNALYAPLLLAGRSGPHAVWWQTSSTTSGGIYAAELIDGSWVPDGGVRLSESDNLERAPVAATTPDSLTLAWQATAPTTSIDIVARRGTNLATLGPVLRVRATPGSQILPAIAADDAQAFIAWSNLTALTVEGRALFADGGLGPVRALGAGRVNDPISVAVVHGAFVVAWMVDGSDVISGAVVTTEAVRPLEFTAGARSGVTSAISISYGSDGKGQLAWLADDDGGSVPTVRLLGPGRPGVVCTREDGCLVGACVDNVCCDRPCPAGRCGTGRCEP